MDEKKYDSRNMRRKVKGISKKVKYS